MYMMIGKVNIFPVCNTGNIVTDLKAENELLDRILRTKEESIVEYNK
jgi:hypothetical protein